MDRRTLLVSGCALSLAATTRTLRAAPIDVDNTPLLGGPCEGCEWVFDDMPARLDATTRIAPASERGRPFFFEGTVRDSRGGPAPGMIIYAYHTNDAGLYPPAGNLHGTLRGWARTDARGNYRFESIRPRAYPGRDIPEHVHMHVIEPGVGTYYIDDLRFEDDPLIHAGNRRTSERGGNGLVMPARGDGGWHARRDIVLGRNVPEYPARR